MYFGSGAPGTVRASQLFEKRYGRVFSLFCPHRAATEEHVLREPPPKKSRGWSSRLRRSGRFCNDAMLHAVNKHGQRPIFLVDDQLVLHVLADEDAFRQYVRTKGFPSSPRLPDATFHRLSSTAVANATAAWNGDADAFSVTWVGFQEWPPSLCFGRDGVIFCKGLLNGEAGCDHHRCWQLKDPRHGQPSSMGCSSTSFLRCVLLCAQLLCLPACSAAAAAASTQTDADTLLLLMHGLSRLVLTACVHVGCLLLQEHGGAPEKRENQE